jgi:putative CocE/NonD family hydrolase
MSLLHKLLAKKLGLRPARYAVGAERNLRVSMPDGVTLRTDHLYPRASTPCPTILLRSPYYGGRWSRSDMAGLLYMVLVPLFAERGYHVVVQTARGRYDSQGEFTPCSSEREDGLATVEWIARQPWFNGSLGLWGASYDGHVQWAVAEEAPPQLRAMVPVITSSNFSQLLFPGGVPSDFALLYATAMAVAANPSAGTLTMLRQAGPGSMARTLGPAQNHLPLNEADIAATGHAIPYYREWLAHPPDDATFWRCVDHREAIARSAAPAHIITGWYDFCQPGALADYATLRAAGRAPYLTVGPYQHGPAVVLDSVSLSLDWFDVYLGGEPVRLREEPVRVYVLGAREPWREMAAWPPPATETRYHLHAGRRLSVGAPEADSAPDQYRYDPADPTPAVAGVPPTTPLSPLDSRALEARPDVLSYTTAPLERALEIMGPVRLDLHVLSTLAHTDFLGRLCDVHPDGRSINLCEGLLRLAPGRGEAQADGTLHITVEMGAIAACFQPGHAIRLQVASGAHPRWQRNLGAGDSPGSATRMLSAEQTIYHDADHPSALLLPVTTGV